MQKIINIIMPTAIQQPELSSELVDVVRFTVGLVVVREVVVFARELEDDVVRVLEEVDELLDEEVGMPKLLHISFNMDRFLL